MKDPTRESIRLVILLIYVYICVTHGPKELEQAAWMAGACALAWIHGSLIKLT